MVNTQGKRVIGVDCDNVLSHTEDSVVEILSGLLGRALGTSSYESCTGASPVVPPEVTQKALKVFHKPEVLYGLEPLSGAAETLRRLSEHYELIIITARPSYTRADTSRWLEKHGIPFDALLFAHDDSGNPLPKYRVADDFVGGATLEAMVEDHLPTALEFLCEGKAKRVFLFDYPWNREGAKNYPCGKEDASASSDSGSASHSPVRVNSLSQIEQAMLSPAPPRPCSASSGEGFLG